MRTSAVRRGIAILLCVQPTFWVSGPALAQTIERPAVTPFGSATDVDLRRGGDDGPTFGGEPVSPGERRPGADLQGAEQRAAVGFVSPAAPPIDEPVDPDRYVCSPGDVLELNFWGLQNFRLKVKVDLEGRAFIPKIGYLELRGRTLSDVRKLLRESVARFYPRLGFDLTLAEPRSFLVQVVDGVRKPGAYPARAIDRVSSIITQAGGFAPNGSQRRIEVVRRNGTVVRADLLRYGQTGDLALNPLLLDGDVVRVPFVGVAVQVDGAVNRPGRYELVGGRDLAEAVELAGGLAPSRTAELPVRVVRRSLDEHEGQIACAWAPDDALPTLALQHDDYITIPSYKELQRSVMVIGAIGDVAGPEHPSSTRRLPYVEGDTVRTLIERVGGVGSLADLTGAYVVRGGTAIAVDLNALFMLRELSADVPIELGDTVVVPFKRRSIIVSGAVFKPGEYPYNPTYGVQQYLSLAGGPNRLAKSLGDVRVVTPDGRLKEYRSDLRVDPGSSLVVPERSFSRPEIVQIAIGAAGILLSGVAVILSVR